MSAKLAGDWQQNLEWDKKYIQVFLAILGYILPYLIFLYNHFLQKPFLFFWFIKIMILVLKEKCKSRIKHTVL